MTKTVVLSSGGLDSFIAWRCYAPKDAVPLFVNVGQKYWSREIVALNKLVNAVPDFNLRTANGPGMRQYELPSGIIPNRNAELILAASQIAENIVLGVLAEEINSDKSVEFFDAMEDLLNISWLPQYWNNDKGRKFAIWSPIRHLTKTELIKSYLAKGHPVGWLHHTVSCYAGTDAHCGTCPSCFKRWIAFTNCGIEQDWVVHPGKTTLAHEAFVKAHNGVYGQERAHELLEAFGKAGLT